MADTSGLVLPIVGGLFALVVVMIGAYLCYYYYCNYLKVRNNERGGQRTNVVPFNYFAASNPYLLHSLAGVSPSAQFGGFPCPSKVHDRKISEKSTVHQESNKEPDKINTCRSSSYEKTLRSPSHLHVIQEMKEDEEENDKDEGEVNM